jgi:hypothetical protein
MAKMTKIVTVLIVMLLCISMNNVSFGNIITIDVQASSAPNAYGSPSWNTYLSNSLYALENGLTSYGGNRATDPTAYEAAPDIIGPGEIAVTSFNSWRGIVNPVAPFDNEHGNRIHFGLHAYGDGNTQFRLQDLSFDMHSSDPGDTLALGADFSNLDYNGARIGIDWVDGIKGNGDDIIYTTGNGSTWVDEIVYVGAGNAWWPGYGGSYGSDPANPIGGTQAAMNDYFAWVNSEAPILVTMTYTIGDYTGSDSVTVVPVPAAVILGVLGMSVAGLKLRKNN